MLKTDELRTTAIEALVSPQALLEQLPLCESVAQHIATARRQVERILTGEDQRLLVIVGPCSIHDPDAALDYARRLKALRFQYQDSLEIVMRAYFEKPRTIVGWKGLISDPHLDGSYDINHGLQKARRLLLMLNEMGLPTATEFLDMVTGQYIADLVTWGAIGARTTESQIHREMASALSCPIGFKNGTDGNIRIALDAIRAARAGHLFLSPDKQGKMTVYKTHGNPYGHVIMRGGKKPNYAESDVTDAAAALSALGLAPHLIVDFSHGNSEKQHARQLIVGEEICRQIRAGSSAVVGVMIESFIEEGNQPLGSASPLTYGQSVTDACLGFADTAKLIDGLASAVRASRTL